jgi:hypothetical protein
MQARQAELGYYAKAASSLQSYGGGGSSLLSGSSFNQNKVNTGIQSNRDDF